MQGITKFSAYKPWHQV